MLRLLDIEIGKVTELEKTALGMERKRRKYKMDEALVLPQEAMDLNNRYETHFARDLVRLLRLYESARRICLAPVKFDDKS